MTDRINVPVQRVATWGTGVADVLQEPILRLTTLEGGDYTFQMPAQAAEKLARGLLVEVARLRPGAAH